MKRFDWRILIPLPFLGVAVALLWWRGPDWHAVRGAFTVVTWGWVLAALGLNLLSVVVRSLCWKTAIGQAMPPPHPGWRLVFAAFGVGLFGNVVLPGRVGELARVAVLARRLPGRKGIWATLVGSVFAHRAFDLFPAMTLVAWVLVSAKLPSWAFTSFIVVIAAGAALFAAAILTARSHSTHLEGLGRIRQLLARIRFGLAIMRKPLPAITAGAFQFAGWLCQLAAVWAAMRAFHIYLPLAAAGLVLVLMNVATIFPLWPGNVGLVQAAVALPLVPYGVDYARGFAYGIGLQAIEASVGIGIGLIFLAREGFSYAALKEIPDAESSGEELDEPAEELDDERTRVPG
ncbi:MAG: flippase-like domain-containing protein [Actinobacteria bacterium]|nr:flippase-like domain-containing protein [Actinomycetota bacterium]MBV8395529.1 flippase-like domain-containing protein [Actinomycetota bacterium]MBV8597504.1 flippase-like domain-containing protein [Actinomycetota bacterium]